MSVFDTISPGLLPRRYTETVRNYSPAGDPFDDLLNQLGFLTSHDFVTDLLVSKHGVMANEADVRAKSIIAHVRVALAFVDQSRRGPVDVSFLPSYYAILNFVKLYILVSPKHADLPANRWHGAQYGTDTKDRDSLLTEEIEIKAGGAIPLFYEAMTGEKCPIGVVRLVDIYPYITDCSAEWQRATGTASQLAGLVFAVTTNDMRRLEGEVSPPWGVTAFSLADLPMLRDLDQDAQNRRRLIGKNLAPLSKAPDEMVREVVDPLFVYHPLPTADAAAVAFGATRLKMFEELPICLAFFHLSSVARYNPEFLGRLRDSKYWPVIAAAGRQSVFRFLVLFWSYVNRATITFERQ